MSFCLFVVINMGMDTQEFRQTGTIFLGACHTVSTTDHMAVASWCRASVLDVGCWTRRTLRAGILNSLVSSSLSMDVLMQIKAFCGSHWPSPNVTETLVLEEAKHVMEDVGDYAAVLDMLVWQHTELVRIQDIEAVLGKVINRNLLMQKFHSLLKKQKKTKDLLLCHVVCTLQSLSKWCEAEHAKRSSQDQKEFSICRHLIECVDSPLPHKLLQEKYRMFKKPVPPMYTKTEIIAQVVLCKAIQQIHAPHELLAILVQQQKDTSRIRIKPPPRRPSTDTMRGASPAPSTTTTPSPASAPSPPECQMPPTTTRSQASSRTA